MNKPTRSYAATKAEYRLLLTAHYENIAEDLLSLIVVEMHGSELEQTKQAFIEYIRENS